MLGVNEMKNNKIVKFSFIAVILFSLMIFVPGCGSNDQDIVRVGAILPLTGDLASYGVDTRKALELAAKQINNKGGINNKQVEVIFEDSKGTSSLAASAINKLISVDNVIGILGPITSPEVLSISPIANNNEVPIISPSSTSVDISDAGDYVFRTINADNIETVAFAQFVKNKMNCPNIGIIANQAAGTLSYADSFEKYYTENNCNIASKELFQENLKDFKTPVTKLSNNKEITGIYISGVSMEIGLITKQIRQYNQHIQLYSYQSAEDRRVVELAGETVNGMIFSSTSLPENYLGESREKFINAFKDEFGKVPGIFAPEIYDGFNILIEAYKNSINSDHKLIYYLSRTSDYNGTSGKITFDKNGDVHKAIAIYQYQNQVPKPLFIVENQTFIPVN